MKKFLLTTVALAVAGWGCAEIQPLEGTNVVGFAAITAPGGVNTIITVPFEACLESGAAGMLSDLVATNGLTSHATSEGDADQLVVLTTNGATQVYYYYWNKTGFGWTEITSAMLMPDGSSQAVTPPAATNFPVARGLGFWIKRKTSGVSTVYVKGQVSSEKQATTISEGLNLIGYGGLESVALNAIDWTGAYGINGISATTDRILVGNGDGTYTTYFYYVKKAGSSSYYDQFTNLWVKSTSSGPALPSSSLPVGQGFWYHRRGTGDFTFRPDGL